MKKLLAVILSLAMVLSLAACGGEPAKTTEAPKQSTAAPAQSTAAPAQSTAAPETTAAPRADWPKGPIEIIVPFAAGGAMDLSARLTGKYLEKYLGVTVTINNMTGGANWVGYQAIEDADGDGYTLGFANYPGQVGGYLDPSKARKETFRDFTNIANIVHDPGIIVVREDSPYQTLQELLDAAKSGTVLNVATGGGNGSDDDTLVRLINRAMGNENLNSLKNENDANAKQALFGGEADLQACNVSNYCKTYMNKGQTDSVRVLAIFDANKQDLMSDIPTIDELNIPELKGLYSSSDRGLIATKKLDPAVLAIIVDALKKTETDPEFIADASSQGMAIHMLFGDDFNAFIEGVEQTIKDLKIYE